MCRLLFIALFTVQFISGQAQEYRKFRIGLGLGVNTMHWRFQPWAIEPSRRVLDNVYVGTRLEFISYPKIENRYSFTNNVQYYLKSKRLPNSFRYFVGLGVGIYYTVSRYQVIFPMQGYTIYRFDDGVKGTWWGGYPRIGFEYKHFALMAEYNFVQKKHVHMNYYTEKFANVNVPNSWSTDFYSSNSYFSVKAVYYVGGGKKKKTQ